MTKRIKQPKKEAIFQTHLYLPESLRKKVQAEALVQNRSITGQIEFILANYYQQQPERTEP